MRPFSHHEKDAKRAGRELGFVWLVPELIILLAIVLAWRVSSGVFETLWRDAFFIAVGVGAVYALVTWRITRLTKAMIERAREADEARGGLTEAANENARLLAIANQRNEALAALSRRVGEALSASLDPRPIGELVIEQALHVIHCDRAVITLRDRADENHPAPVFHVLAAIDSTGARTRELLPEGSVQDYPFLETVFASERPAFIEDAFTDSRLQEKEKRLAKTANIRSMMLAPMRGRTRNVTGLLVLTWLSKPYHPSEEEFRAAEALAAQAALATENTQLYHSLAQAQKDLQIQLHETTQSRDLAQQTASRIDLLLQVSQKLNASLDVTQINQIVVRAAFELAMASCQIKQTALYRYDRQASELARVARFPKARGRGAVSTRSTRTSPALPPEVFTRPMLPGPTYFALYVKRRPLVTRLPEVSERDKADTSRFDLLDEEEAGKLAVRFPLVAQDEVLGHITLLVDSLPDAGPHDGDGGERAVLLSALNSLASLAAISLYNARLYERVEERAQQMTTLWSVGRAISAHLDVGEIADTLSREITRVLGADLCVLSLSEQGRLVPQGRAAEKAPDRLAYGLPDCECDLITREAARGSAPISQTGIDGRAAGKCRWKRVGAAGAHCVLAVPLAFDDHVLGVLSVYRGGMGGFSQDEIDLTTTLGSLSVAAIRNARSFEHEHNIAETLQTFFLTAPPAHVPGFDLAEKYYPTSEEAKIGGDYFDFIPLGSSRLAILIGDISGKGLAAAAYTAMAKYTLRAFASTPNIQPSQVVEFTNLAMTRHTSGEIFSTLFYGVLDFTTNTLTYVNAGHEPPLVLRHGQSQFLQPTGTMVGAFPDATYDQDVHSLQAGDILALYTDGLTDARSPDGAFFTNAGMASLLKSQPHGASASEMADALYARVREFSAGALSDDIALLVVKAL